MPESNPDPPVLQAALAGLLVDLATIADGLRWTAESLAAARHKLLELQNELAKLLQAHQAP